MNDGHDEVVELLVDQISDLERRLEEYPVSFTTLGFIGYTLFICAATVLLVLFVTS